MALDRRYTSGGYMPLRDAIDHLFQGSIITPQALGQGGFPPTDLYTTDDNVIIEMAIPGVNPNDVNVSVTGDTVTVSGEVKHQRHTQQGQQPYVEEMWQGKFQRAFTLPIQVDANKAQANYQDGILTLTLPKSESTKPRKIQVQQQQTLSGQSQSQQPSGTKGTTERETVPVTSGSTGKSSQSNQSSQSGS
ncbi:MAG: Hsp20/alpha crystallin family protein [Chloroflexota bacterium]|nr:Hsp20/alpha crystallin family protein [Chloroflexota bacterium]